MMMKIFLILPDHDLKYVQIQITGNDDGDGDDDDRNDDDDEALLDTVLMRHHYRTLPSTPEANTTSLQPANYPKLPKPIENINTISNINIILRYQYQDRYKHDLPTAC